MGRPLGIAAVVVLIGFAIAVLLSGEPVFLVPVVILALLIGGYALFNKRMHEKVLDDAGGSHEDAMGDSDEAIPSAHLVPDDDTPAGDTSEAHDEINPHDLPMDHPGRMAAERESGALEGTTRGSVDSP
jgi:hypothetical protein